MSKEWDVPDDILCTILCALFPTGEADEAYGILRCRFQTVSLQFRRVITDRVMPSIQTITPLFTRTLAGHNRLSLLPCLTELNISGLWCDSTLPSLVALTCLRTLHLNEFSIEAHTMSQLAGLHTLSLTNIAFDRVDISPLTNLTALDLCHTPITVDDLMPLTTLQSLSYFSHNIVFRPVNRLTQLRSLNLFRYGDVEDIVGMTNLTALQVTGAVVSDHVLATMPQLSPVPGSFPVYRFTT